MKKNLFIIVALCFVMTLVACKKFSGSQEIPAYLHVEKFNFKPMNSYDVEGALTTNISDAWVYVDDKLHGCYELPFTVPVLFEKEHKITLYPGIKLNGISGTRVAYPFYQPYSEYVELTPKDTTTVAPESMYYKVSETALRFAIEDFDNQHELKWEAVTQSDTIMMKTERDDKYTWVSPQSHFSGHVALRAADSVKYFCAATQELYNMPTSGGYVLLELDYKTDITFEVGMFAAIHGAIKTIDLVYVKPTEEWKKIYINLGPQMTDNSSATYFKIFIASNLFDEEEAHLCFDNIKLVYREQ